MGALLKPHKILLKKARGDLKAAKVLLEAFNEGVQEFDLELVMFHLQQSAEKLFKALLDSNSVRFPRTHDLEVLYNLCMENSISIFEEIEELIPLSDFAVEGRYSIFCGDIEDVEKYIR